MALLETDFYWPSQVPNQAGLDIAQYEANWRKMMGAVNAQAVIAGIAGLQAALDGKAPYAAGYWTPSVAGNVVAGTQTYTRRTGTYFRLGQLVLALFDLVGTAKDAAASGTIAVSGLPYVNTPVSYGHVFISIYYGMPTPTPGSSQLMGLMNPGTNYILLNNSGPGEAMITLPDIAGMAQSFGVYGACLYVAA